MRVKYKKIYILLVAFFSLKFVRIVFVSSSDYSITTLHIIAESFIILAKFFSIFAVTCRRIPDIIFSHA